MSTDIEARVRDLLEKHAQLRLSLPELVSDANLYEAGMTSRASVSVMLALEGDFGIEFPDAMLRRDVFESVAAITRAVVELSKGETL